MENFNIYHPAKIEVFEKLKGHFFKITKYYFLWSTIKIRLFLKFYLKQRW